MEYSGEELSESTYRGCSPSSLCSMFLLDSVSTIVAIYTFALLPSGPWLPAYRLRLCVAVTRRGAQNTRA